MSAFCPAPDPMVGIVLRMSSYIDCQARVLGENGFLALAGGPMGSALLSSAIAILIALIGYRLILGPTPDLRDGIGWTVRIGLALTLLGSWPAFQTVIYRVVVDGPQEVAGVILPSSGLPAQGVPERVQLAYDTIRLGSVLPTSGSGDGPSIAARTQVQGAAPRSAIMFLIGEVGFPSAIKIAIGFLLAIGPLPIIALILGGMSGMFGGWLKTLIGVAIAAVATSVAGSIELVMIESELARLQAYRTAATLEIIDDQALAAIALTFLIVAPFIVLAAVLITARLEVGGRVFSPGPRAQLALGRASPEVRNIDRGSSEARTADRFAEQSRDQQIASSLVRSSYRERLAVGPSPSPLIRGSAPTADERIAAAGVSMRSGSRRTRMRHSRAATQRDGSQ